MLPLWFLLKVAHKTSIVITKENRSETARFKTLPVNDFHLKLKGFHPSSNLNLITGIIHNDSQLANCMLLYLNIRQCRKMQHYKINKNRRKGDFT